MPLYMDVHTNISGATPQEVFDAHLLDLTVQDRYGVEYLTYWFNEGGGKIFCLMTGRDKEACEAVHREAHGLLADEIIEVQGGDVAQFLGVNEDLYPQPQASPEDPSALDTGFRTVMFTDMEGSTLHAQRMGDAAHMELLRAHNTVIRACLEQHRGSEIKHTGDGVMASFASVARALDCAIAIQRAFNAPNDGAAPMRVRIGLSAGEPVGEGADLFGATVQLARRMCDHGASGQIMVPNVIRELCIGKPFRFESRGDASLKGFDDPVRVYEVAWRG